MAWTTAKDELRSLLSDGPKDKLRHRKAVFGTLDGVNTTFKTFEFRRLSDFTSVSSPEGVFVNGVAAGVSSDDPSNTGEFQLTTAPNDGDNIEATYFIQWFLDTELDHFLLSAAQWLTKENAEGIEAGLRPAALHYAAQEAYMKLSLRWAEMLSETYRLEDAPGDNHFQIVDTYKNAAMDMHRKSIKLRDDFYERAGQSKQPLFASIAGTVGDPVPKR